MPSPNNSAGRAMAAMTVAAMGMEVATKMAEPNMRDRLLVEMDRYIEQRRAIQRGPVGYRKVRVYKPNGAGECARRLRQIAAGSLKAENGLVT